MRPRLISQRALSASHSTAFDPKRKSSRASQAHRSVIPCPLAMRVGQIQGWLAIWISISAFVILAPTIASAAVQWKWTFGSSPYSTKQEAVAAMHASSSANSVLTVEQPYDMAPTQVTYKYTAPPVAATVSPWVYQAANATFSNEADAVAAQVAQFNSYPQCGSGYAIPVNDWAPNRGSVDTFESKNFDFYEPTTDRLGVCQPVSEFIHWGLSRVRTATCPAHYSTYFDEPSDSFGCSDTDFSVITGVPLTCPCQLAPAPNPSALVGNPVDASTGDKFQMETDYVSPTLNLTRYYHSAILESFHSLGVGWTHNYAARLWITNGLPRGLDRPNGYHDPLLSISSTSYISQSGTSIHVQQSGSNWIAYLGDGSEEVYNSAGLLVQLIAPNGQTTALNYNLDGTLASVSDPFGHSLQFGYDSHGSLIQVTDPAGLSISYGYDNANNLVSATFQDGTSRVYAYENPTFPNNLTGITDEVGVRFATFGYDAMGRANCSQHGGGATCSLNSGGSNLFSITYGTAAATVTDGIGGTTAFAFTSGAYTQRITSVSHNGLTTSFVVPSVNTDIQQRITQTTDENGHISSYTYDTCSGWSNAAANQMPGGNLGTGFILTALGDLSSSFVGSGDGGCENARPIACCDGYPPQ